MQDKLWEQHNNSNELDQIIQITTDGFNQLVSCLANNEIPDNTLLDEFLQQTEQVGAAVSRFKEIKWILEKVDSHFLGSHLKQVKKILDAGKYNTPAVNRLAELTHRIILSIENDVLLSDEIIEAFYQYLSEVQQDIKLTQEQYLAQAKMAEETDTTLTALLTKKKKASYEVPDLSNTNLLSRAFVPYIHKNTEEEQIHIKTLYSEEPYYSEDAPGTAPRSKEPYVFPPEDQVKIDRYNKQLICLVDNIKSQKDALKLEEIHITNVDIFCNRITARIYFVDQTALYYKKIKSDLEKIVIRLTYSHLSLLD
jgi:uncharacterized protein (UPF0305 family)